MLKGYKKIEMTHDRSFKLNLKNVEFQKENFMFEL